MIEDAPLRDPGFSIACEEGRVCSQGLEKGTFFLSLSLVFCDKWFAGRLEGGRKERKERMWNF